jgi:hypothetical protein
MIGEAFNAVDEDITVHEQIVQATTRLRDLVAPFLLRGDSPSVSIGTNRAHERERPASTEPWVPS